MLDVDADEFSSKQGGGISRKLFGPGLLIAETIFTGVLRDTENAIHGKYLAGRGGNIAFKRRKFMIEPLARLLRGTPTGKLEFEFRFLAERDDDVMLRFSLLRCFVRVILAKQWKPSGAGDVPTSAKRERD